jgi:putative ABC transport system substrate-binding protein
VIDRRAFIAVLALTATPCTARAQPRKTARIGVLSPFSVSSGPAPSFQVFRDALRELGHVDGENLVFDYRWAEGKLVRIPELAAELVRSKPDVVLSAWSTPAALAAKAATTTIPIVFIGVGDAVAVGLVASPARPGGNVTGSTFLAEETVGKQLQLLKEAVPTLSRVATLTNPANPVYAPLLRGIETMGRRIQVEVTRLNIQGPDDVEPAFESARRERVGGLVVLRDPVLITSRARVVELAARHRLPVMYGWREFVDAGGLMSFEPNLPDLHRRAAGLVHRLLKGARPQDLPLEQSSKFDLVINLKTARALGLTIPPSMLLRAEQVIE